MFLYFLHRQSWLSSICRFLLSLPRETTYKKFSKVELQVCNHNRNKAMEQECAAELCRFCLIELFPSRKSLMFGGRKKISSKWFSHMMYFSGPHASFPGIVG